jgi:hypothetical protein
MECTLCLGYIIVLYSHCLVCGYLCVEGPPPLGRLLYELVLRSALVQVSAAARARLLYVLRPAQPRAVSYSAGRERARQQARSGGRCYQRRPPTATRNVIEPGPKELVVVSMCCGALWVQRLSLRHTPLDPRAGGGRCGWRASGDGTSGRPRAPRAGERGRERGRCVLRGRTYVFLIFFAAVLALASLFPARHVVYHVEVDIRPNHMNIVCVRSCAPCTPPLRVGARRRGR